MRFDTILKHVETCPKTPMIWYVSKTCWDLFVETWWNTINKSHTCLDLSKHDEIHKNCPKWLKFERIGNQNLTWRLQSYSKDRERSVARGQKDHYNTTKQFFASFSWVMKHTDISRTAAHFCKMRLFVIELMYIFFNFFFHFNQNVTVDFQLI